MGLMLVFEEGVGMGLLVYTLGETKNVSVGFGGLGEEVIYKRRNCQVIGYLS